MFSYALPVYVEFGQNTSRHLGSIAKSKRYQRLLLVTDGGVMRAKLVEPLIESLKLNRVEYTLFDKVESNPKDTTVELALQTLKEERCDSVAAVGGGSSLDVGKVVSMLATNEGDLHDYEVHVDASLNEEHVKKYPLPLFAVPTTAGTGSEVDFWAVITDTSRKAKILVGQAPLRPNGPYMGATVALVDPTMTLTLPPRQTAATGFDAFIHGMECYTSRATAEMFQILALDTAELAATWLPKAYADSLNIEAREKMMLAAHLGGICLNNGGLGAIHALAEAIGGSYENIPHGYALAAVAPSVLKFNSPAISEHCLELERRIHPENLKLPPNVAVHRLIETICQLIQTLHLPSNLRTLNIKPEDLPEIATKAAQAIEITSNPMPTHESDLLEMLKESC